MSKKSLIGLVLTGGGARGAYQAGALQAIHEIIEPLQIDYPYPIISGTSAGAINAAFMASYIHSMPEGIERLIHLWQTIKTERVFKIGPMTMARISMRVMVELMSGQMYREKKSRSLLNTSPLAKLIKKH